MSSASWQWRPRDLAVVVLLALSGCRKAAPTSVEPAPPEAVAPESHRDARVEAPTATLVLVTIDGARWQDLVDGADPSLAEGDVGEWAEPEKFLPHLHALIRRGVLLGGDPACGAVRPVGTSNISLPGYLEILTGRSTTCSSNFCSGTSTPTLLDDAASTGLGVASFSSWEPLARAATSGAPSPHLIVSAGTELWKGARPAAGSLLERLVVGGSRAGPSPAPDGPYRPDVFTAAIALEHLRTNAPRLLHLGMGDPDEHAHQGDYLAYAAALRAIDDLVGDIVVRVGSRPLTMIITADHGRAVNFRDHGATNPESARSFVIAYGEGVVPRGSVCLDHDVTLADVGATVRALLGLPPESTAGAGRPITEVLASP